MGTRRKKNKQAGKTCAFFSLSLSPRQTRRRGSRRSGRGRSRRACSCVGVWGVGAKKGRGRERALALRPRRARSALQLPPFKHTHSPKQRHQLKFGRHVAPGFSHGDEVQLVQRAPGEHPGRVAVAHLGACGEALEREGACVPSPIGAHTHTHAGRFRGVNTSARRLDPTHYSKSGIPFPAASPTRARRRPPNSPAPSRSACPGATSPPAVAPPGAPTPNPCAPSFPARPPRAPRAPPHAAHH